MTATRTFALAALTTIALTFQVAQAEDPPKKADHPAKKTEHPKAEHPTGVDHSDHDHGHGHSHAEHPGGTVGAPVPGNLIEVATKAGNYSVLLTAIETAGLTARLQGEGDMTIFAPTDAAFGSLPKGMMDDLLKPANKAQLAGFLANHVVPGKIMAADLRTMKATNVNGQDLDIVVEAGRVSVNGVAVVNRDVTATNGVIHGVSGVIAVNDGAKEPEKEAPKDHPAH